MDALAGTVYVNVIIIGAARYTINIISAILEVTFSRIGRRLLHCASAGFIAIVMGIISLIYLFKCLFRLLIEREKVEDRKRM